MPIEIFSASGAGITPWLPALARLRIDVFREFPYLYQGSDDYERNYLQTYVRSPGSIAVLALDAGKVIGAATGLPLADEDDAFKRPFLEQGLNVSDVFYCAESVLLPGYRGKGLYRQFFAGREQQARTLPGIKWLAFCAVQRPLDHPLRPTDYQPLDAIWAHFGYQIAPGLQAQFQWQDIDETASTAKTMQFYLKAL